MSIVAPSPTSVYRYYDRRSVLLYVGITSRGSSRNREHNATKEWWQYVVRQDVEHYPTRDAAARRERTLIRQYEPPFNRQHNKNHAQARNAYLAALELPDEVTESLGGTVATKRARQIVTHLNHRVSISKVAQGDGSVTYRVNTKYKPLIDCVNFQPRMPLVYRRRLGSLRRAWCRQNQWLIEFSCSEEVSAPQTAIVSMRITQKPFTIWAHRAVAA